MEIKDLGLVAFDEAWKIQERCVNQAIEARDKCFLLLCEHPVVLTLGRLADRKHILLSDQELLRRNISVVPVNRGGEVTLHAPGQLVIYPIFNLENSGKDLHQYLHELEEVGIDFLRLFDIVGRRISGKTGVWIGEKKIISIGIGVRKWVAFHGMSINIAVDLNLFDVIHPCGMDVEMTSIEHEGKNSFSMEDAKKKIVNVFQQRFGEDS
ncbi:MAG: lipoyl(octanoyl) transferase LipB [Candidatus Omnitrophota bacterium]